MKKYITESEYKIIIIIIFVIFLLVLIPDKNHRVDLKHNDYIVNPSEVKRDQETIVMAIEAPEISTNPFYDRLKEVGPIPRLINPSLIEKNINGDWNLFLAEDYWYEDDGMTIGFKLRDDVFFSDGRRLTSEDIVTTYKVLSDPLYEGSHSNYVEKIKGAYEYRKGINIENFGVESQGPNIVKFKFINRDYQNIQYLDFPIVNSQELEYEYKYLENVKNFKSKHGAGYFAIQGEPSSNEVNLIAKSDLNSELRKIKIISSNYFEGLKNYKNGNIDILYKFDKDIKLSGLLNERTLDYTNIQENQGDIYQFIGFNMKDSIFSHSDYRKALKHSLDLNELNDNFYGQENYFLSDTPIYANSYLNSKKKNQENINSLEEVLGLKYEKNSSGIFIDKDGKELIIKLIASTHNSFIIETEEILKNQLLDQGILLEIEYLEDANIFHEIYEGGDFDLFVMQRYMIEIPNLQNQFIFNSKGDYNISSYRDDNIIRSLDILQYIVDKEHRRYEVSLWEKSFLETTPYIIINIPKKITLINKRIENIIINEFSGIHTQDNLKNIKILTN